MNSILNPSESVVNTFLSRQTDLAFNYHHVGATRETPPAGFKIDHTRAQLGTGVDLFRAARTAIEQWQQLDLGWLRAQANCPTVTADAVVATIARSMGVWWFNVCRVIYVIDEADRQYGFGYGTLAGHMAKGEERFLVEIDDKGQVWYDILAFSKPERLLARVGYPYLRVVQKRFARQSVARMQQLA